MYNTEDILEKGETLTLCDENYKINKVLCCNYLNLCYVFHNVRENLICLGDTDFSGSEATYNILIPKTKVFYFYFFFFGIWVPDINVLEPVNS